MTQDNTTADGGPAFPEAGLSNLPNGEFIHGRAGMTLRDYFAAKADIPWEVAADIVYRENGNKNGTVPDILSKRSALRYESADAMLKARQS